MCSSSSHKYDTGIVTGDIIVYHPQGRGRQYVSTSEEFFSSKKPCTNPWHIMTQDDLLAGGWYDEERDQVNVTITMRKGPML